VLVGKFRLQTNLIRVYTKASNGTHRATGKYSIESKSKRFLLLKKKIKFSWQMNVFMLREILYDWLGGGGGGGLNPKNKLFLRDMEFVEGKNFHI
jgi:hypothetical protein